MLILIECVVGYIIFIVCFIKIRWENLKCSVFFGGVFSGYIINLVRYVSFVFLMLR